MNKISEFIMDWFYDCWKEIREIKEEFVELFRKEE